MMLGHHESLTGPTNWADNCCYESSCKALALGSSRPRMQQLKLYGSHCISLGTDPVIDQRYNSPRVLLLYIHLCVPMRSREPVDNRSPSLLWPKASTRFEVKLWQTPCTPCNVAQSLTLSVCRSRSRAFSPLKSLHIKCYGTVAGMSEAPACTSFNIYPLSSGIFG